MAISGYQHAETKYYIAKELGMKFRSLERAALWLNKATEWAFERKKERPSDRELAALTMHLLANKHTEARNYQKAVECFQKAIAWGRNEARADYEACNKLMKDFELQEEMMRLQLQIQKNRETKMTLLNQKKELLVKEREMLHGVFSMKRRREIDVELRKIAVELFEQTRNSTPE